jgi:hypothetical protein
MHTHQFYLSAGHTISDRAISDALGVLEGKALHDGNEPEAVHLRVAEHGGRIYLFLADQSHTVIEIDTEGWRVCPEPPVNFVKPKGMNAMPLPQKGGTFDLFRKYLNLSDTDLVLALAWMTAALRPVGPYPVLNLNSEQGSGKTTATRVLKRLVDPTESEDRAEPRASKDMMIAANNEHVLAWDNLSHLPTWCSDALCRIATGSSSTFRKLFMDVDEIIIKVQRPQILNGIGEVATRADLLERSLMLRPRAIPKDKRRPEDGFWAEFEQDRAKLLGFLLTSVSTALRNLRQVTLLELPRMADFANWSVAAEPAWGIPEGSFLEAYQGNQAEAQDIALESSSVAQAVLAMIETEGCYTGQPQEALKKLATYADPDGKVGDVPVFFNRPPDWPRDGRGLTNELKRLAPVLRSYGIDYSPSKKNNGLRIMSLCKQGSGARVASVS